jgi:hypothetical protein
MIRRQLARWLSLKRSTRLRVAGTLVLVGGIAGACLFYWIQSHSAAPVLDEFVPGYTRAREHQMGVMMGTLGVVMAGWMDRLADPGPQAIIIAALAALVSALCFRVAWLMDLPETNPAHWPSAADRG